jgi:hypothetical protein
MSAKKKNSVPLPEVTPVKEVRYYSQRQIIWGIIITFVGLIIFLVGARPGIFSLDRSPVIGFVQIIVFNIGLVLICVGGYIGMKGLWKNRPTSIIADIGMRFVSTGFIIAFFSGMADILGISTRGTPGIPYFGPVQAGGVIIGQVIIGIGFIMLIPFTSRPNKVL